MRRHPLIHRRMIQAGGVIAALLLVAGAVVAWKPLAGDGRTSVTISTASGQELAFEPARIAVAAPGPVAITFRNASELPHNLVFVGGLTSATRTIVAPGAEDQLTVAFTEPGRYGFVCTIHEGMTGSVTVEGAMTSHSQPSPSWSPSSR